MISSPEFIRIESGERPHPFAKSIERHAEIAGSLIFAVNLVAHSFSGPRAFEDCGQNTQRKFPDWLAVGRVLVVPAIMALTRSQDRIEDALGYAAAGQAAVMSGSFDDVHVARAA